MKQRLIDANEFAIEEPKLWDWNSIDDISSTAVLKQCIWDVQCAPTVDAIPVAFIEEKMRKYEELAYNSTPKIQQRYFDKEDALKSLIYYWHEKNEKGDDDATV